MEDDIKHGVSICPICKQEIDLDVCWCGGSECNSYYDGHDFVPMGCICNYKQEVTWENPEGYSILELHIRNSAKPKKENSIEQIEL